ncbi:Pr6Pr family membrane protein [Brachybacterium hainanense]|uniref:Pr6Pr family membrane protein n=1 Tax=Brachybacterium hainanense TaxID=1541174 RepID=A0ABV6RDF7_9MICO
MPTWSRAVHGVVFAVAALTLILQFALTGTGPADPTLPDPGVLPSVVRFFSFFTILSNIMVAAISLLLMLDRPLSLPVRVLRVDSLVAIVITAVVHWFLLRPLGTPEGFLGILDDSLHVVVPLLAVLAWLVAGPRTAVDAAPGTSVAVLLGALAFPLVYAAWTFAYGAISSWYPYGFIDVTVIGYGPALRMAGIILAVFVGLAAAVEGVEQVRARMRLG